jgi:hypothetical protein
MEYNDSFEVFRSLVMSEVFGCSQVDENLRDDVPGPSTPPWLYTLIFMLLGTLGNDIL